jgi:hypothetical protein
LGFALAEPHGVSGPAHAASHTATSAAGKEKETGKERGGENETLGEFTETTGFLSGKNGDINLRGIEITIKVGETVVYRY